MATQEQIDLKNLLETQIKEEQECIDRKIKSILLMIGDTKIFLEKDYPACNQIKLSDISNTINNLNTRTQNKIQECHGHNFTIALKHEQLKALMSKMGE